MKPQNFSELINQIYTTEENELVCSQIQELLPAYIEDEFEGSDLVTSDIKTHLHHCPDCTEIYQGICFLVEQEDLGELILEDPQLLTPPVPQETAVMAPMASSSD